MSALIQISNWCYNERERLRAQRDRVVSDGVSLGENIGAGWVDITAQSIGMLEASITDLDQLLTQYGQRHHAENERS